MNLPGGGYGRGMKLPRRKERDAIGSEVGQSMALVGMTAIVILAALLIGLAV
jgi:hypothetical protein